ncbi:MAG: hypothetical protein QXK66_04435 [Sulfolobales archaeon]
MWDVLYGIRCEGVALSWLKGFIVGYVRNEIAQNNLLGRIKRCLKSYGVMLYDVKVLLNLITLGPFLNLGPPEERRKKLDSLLRSLDELVKVCSGGFR